MVVISLKARESKPVLECARVVIKRERENKKRERESGWVCYGILERECVLKSVCVWEIETEIGRMRKEKKVRERERARREREHQSYRERGGEKEEIWWGKVSWPTPFFPQFGEAGTLLGLYCKTKYKIWEHVIRSNFNIFHHLSTSFWNFYYYLPNYRTLDRIREL